MGYDVQHQFDPIAEIEAAVQASHVRAHGGDGNAEFVRDLPVRTAAQNLSDNLGLPRRQLEFLNDLPPLLLREDLQLVNSAHDYLPASLSTA
jgi:hypothetical protein